MKSLRLTFFIFSFTPILSLAYISEKRLELQAKSRAAVQNFNDWNAVRNQMMAFKEKILQHQSKVKLCLDSLSRSFNESFYLTCVTENAEFEAILIRMPKDSASLNFPKYDVTGNQIELKTQALLVEFEKLVAMSYQTVKTFDEMSKKLRVKELNAKSDIIVTALANEANRSFFCTPPVADLIYKTISPLNLRLLLAKMLGDVVDIQSLQHQIQNIANQLSSIGKYCGNMVEFAEAYTKTNNVLKEATQALNNTPREHHLTVFCKKAESYNDADAVTLCQTYCVNSLCNGPLPTEVFYSVRSVIKRLTLKLGVK